MAFNGDEKSNHEHPDDHPGEWLNLSLGRNQTSTLEDSGQKSRPASAKVFPCNFCMKKFFSSQALGGHQNGHKRERGAVRRYQTQRMTSMTVLPMTRSLGVQAHSLVEKPSRDGMPTSARFTKPSTGFGMAWMDDTMNLMWPGSFHLDRQAPEQLSDTHKLDLNLKL